MLILSSSFRSQTDSLIKQLPKLKGEKKVKTLCDISYYLSATNPEKGQHFGRLALKEARRLKNKSLILQSLNDMSISYINSSKYDTVITLSKEAASIASEIGDKLALGKCWNRISMVYFERGKHKLAIKYNFKALKIFKEEKQVAYQGLILTNIASSYEKLGLLNEAIEVNQRVLKIAQETQNDEMFSSAYGNIGIIYMKQGDHKKAADFYEKSLPYVSRLGDIKRLSTLYQNMGVNARSMGNSEKGIYYYQKSLELYREINESVGLGYIYLNLANCFQDVNNLKTAQKYIDSGLVIGKQTKTIPLIRNAFRALSRHETLTGNFEKADFYFERYESFKDSIMNLEKIKAVSEIQTKYDTQEKEKIILKEKADKESYQKRFYALGGVSLSLLLGLLLIRQRFKLRLKQKTLENYTKLNKERNRIARDLHDNLGAELTIVSSKLDSKIYKTEKNSEKTELEQIANLTRNANVVLRETVWSIQNDNLTILSLSNKIEEFYNRMDSSKSFEIKIENENQEHYLSPLEALNLFRIAQEALNNIYKYAKASNVKVYLSRQQMSISDNGVGFDPNSIKKGYGLNNMQFRANEMEATMEILPLNPGTIIKINLKG